MVSAEADADVMTTFTETFTGHADRERVLTDILRQSPAVPGTTLIAHVDRATLAVLAVRAVPTPDPVFDQSCFACKPIQQLSDLLRAVAQDSAPARTWTGHGWGDITGELITVVCREGEAAVTEVEMQFFWGWRYSNHHTAAFDGDVYVVTPQGWASLLGEWSGPLPALPASAATADTIPADTVPAVQDAERILADASFALLDPNPGECLHCYVHRMVVEFGCDNQLRFAVHYRDVRAPRATGLERRFGRAGAYCDCEIFLNGYDVQPGRWVPEVASESGGISWIEEQPGPTPQLGCRGVRAGSTQPCSLWGRRLRR